MKLVEKAVLTVKDVSKCSEKAMVANSKPCDLRDLPCGKNARS